MKCVLCIVLLLLSEYTLPVLNINNDDVVWLKALWPHLIPRKLDSVELNTVQPYLKEYSGFSSSQDQLTEFGVMLTATKKFDKSPFFWIQRSTCNWITNVKMLFSFKNIARRQTICDFTVKKDYINLFCVKLLYLPRQQNTTNPKMIIQLSRTTL